MKALVLVQILSSTSFCCNPIKPFTATDFDYAIRPRDLFKFGQIGKVDALADCASLVWWHFNANFTVSGLECQANPPFHGA